MNPGDNELRVPKAKITVTLALTGHEPRQVELFVSADEHHRSDRRAVRDLFDQPEGFLPARDVRSGEYLLFKKHGLKWIAIARDQTSTPELFHDEALELFDRRSAVQVEFADGSSLEGEMLFSPPAHSGRVGDHLNRPEPLFTLYQTAQVTLVHKDAVVMVVEDLRKETTGENGAED